MKEYVVWGYANGVNYEQLLVAKLEGEPITELRIAENVVKILEQKHNCTSCRIQVVDLVDNKIKMV